MWYENDKWLFYLQKNKFKYPGYWLVGPSAILAAVAELYAGYGCTS